MADRYQVKGLRIWDSHWNMYSGLYDSEEAARDALKYDRATYATYKPLDQWQDDKPAGERYQAKGRRIWDSENDTYSRLYVSEDHARHWCGWLKAGVKAVEFKPLDQWKDDKPENDPVNHPDHYQGKVECIDAIEAALGIDGFIDHCRGTAMKYIYRAGRKNNSRRSKKKSLKGKDTTVQDLEKAVWYLQRAIKAINQERGT